MIYGGVDPKRAEEIFLKHVLGGEILTGHVVWMRDAGGVESGSEMDFLRPQRRIVLRNCGLIDPESINEYESAGGYQALHRALFDMTPEGIIAEIKASACAGAAVPAFPRAQVVLRGRLCGRRQVRIGGPSGGCIPATSATRR